MTTPPVVTDKTTLDAARSAMRGTVALVPTMGALHAGHAANIRAARAAADHVIVSIFVNPAQFGPNEDLDTYPRTMEADLKLCAAEGVDLVFAPATAVMYPAPTQVVLAPGPRGEILEGASRPGFFGGVLLVVSKLFHLARPHLACFGEKDYQQLAMVRQLVADLNFGIDIVGVPTVRDPDGLALSSRNAYLDADERQAALAISRALRAAAEDPRPREAAAAVLEAEPAVRLDYLHLAAPDLGPAPESGPGRLLVAAHVGATRLIDNAPVHIGVKDA
ncbi:MAG TPA: pantoate--beta-alanine ligase [Stackebrandtia sp.]|jgi:pantoate--beta-alanine ligase|uniref:pantoate--beta-alanine ligase n=1 Tax=Stackebrandtia sp. TaxID=2023065 RepID=UPI002D250AD9|nr:pantoate--beta-alanine ligase [Stackebrandtia sp.]HZE37465.1 pantoate--beta-alanine ligase [Stackebrandtia sp.]